MCHTSSSILLYHPSNKNWKINQIISVTENCLYSVYRMAINYQYVMFHNITSHLLNKYQVIHIKKIHNVFPLLSPPIVKVGLIEANNWSGNMDSGHVVYIFTWDTSHTLIGIFAHTPFRYFWMVLKIRINVLFVESNDTLCYIITSSCQRFYQILKVCWLMALFGH